MTTTNTAVDDIQSKWEFYYWSESKKNSNGMSLLNCLQHYGVGGWISVEKDMVAALVYLSADKDVGNSWLLGLKHLDRTQGQAGSYEQDPYTFHLSSNTALGSRITMSLSDITFDVV
jgi:hypothetical protein